MSQIVSQNAGSLVTTSGTSSSSSSYSFSSSSSSSFSATSSSTSSSSTKVVKQSTTTTKSSSSSSASSSRTSSVDVRSSGMSYSDRIAGDLGIDVGKEMDRLRLCMSNEMANIHSDMFRLMPGSPDAPAPPALDAGGGGSGFVVKLDDNAVRRCIDKAHDDRMKLNFDVQEFDSETINIKTVGNKIEVHAMKKSKKGDEERSEEFSRVYEMPTENDVDPSKVTSSIYKDGVLTIELPVADALGQPPPTQ